MAIDRINSEGSFTNDSRDAANRNFGDISLSTAQVDVTSSTTLVDVTGLTTDAFALYPGKYRFNVHLNGTANAAGGIKVAFKYNNRLTLSALQATAKGFTASAVAVQYVTSTTDAASLLASTSAVIKTEIDGTLTVLTPGTLQIQFAQNASNAAATSVYVGSRAEFTRVGL